jgi:hypothetical protein
VRAEEAGARGSWAWRLVGETLIGMELYSLMYRLGIRPWERYGAAAAGSIAALLDREKSEGTAVGAAPCRRRVAEE